MKQRRSLLPTPSPFVGRRPDRDEHFDVGTINLVGRIAAIVAATGGSTRGDIIASDVGRFYVRSDVEIVGGHTGRGGGYYLLYRYDVEGYPMQSSTVFLPSVQAIAMDCDLLESVNGVHFAARGEAFAAWRAEHGEIPRGYRLDAWVGTYAASVRVGIFLNRSQADAQQHRLHHRDEERLRVDWPIEQEWLTRHVLSIGGNPGQYGYRNWVADRYRTVAKAAA